MAKNRAPFVEANLLDRVIGYFNPKAEQRRIVARTQNALLSGHRGGRGGYTGARRDKATLSNWSPGGGSATADISPDLPALRERSRDQMRNAPVAIGALNTATSHVVGTGLSCTPAPVAKLLGLTEAQAEEWGEATRLKFEAWAASKDCDLARRLDFYDQQDLVFRTWHESGDCFVLTPRLARGRPAVERLALQVLEADRVCNPESRMNTDTLIDGVEIKAETGEAIAIHIAAKHPGDLLTRANTWERREIRGAKSGRLNVLHIMKQGRPGQVRGVPWIAPILEPLKQLERWSEAELNAAVTSALFSVFVKMDAEGFASLFDEARQGSYLDRAIANNWSGEIEAGKAVHLMPGEDISTATPGRPNPEFDPFWVAVVRQIGMALELPYEVLVMHFQSSYSAARAALLMSWKFFRARRDLLAKNFCQPSYELWLSDEVAAGRISASGFFNSDLLRAAWCKAVWTGDGPGSIDPEKEVRAARARVDMEISTLDAESILYDGVDWATKHHKRTNEIAMQIRDGTWRAPAGSPAPPADSTPAPDTSPAPGEPAPPQ